MEIQSNKKTAYFLIELIINCLFFVIAAAICVNLFVSGHLDSTRSNELSVAMTEASNAAEVVKAFDGDSEKIAECLGGASIQDDLVEIYYDEFWQVVEDESLQKYILSISMDNSEEMVNATIIVQSDDRVFFELLEVKHFLGA